MATGTVLALAAFLSVCYTAKPTARSFEIDYEENAFVKEGRLFRVVAGAMHYFQVPHQLWRDRLTKMRAAGVNTLQTYIEWRSHEPENGLFTFSGQSDVVRYIRTAEELGFLVILRLGPYIDAERDMGGLPYWLLATKDELVLRSYNKEYLKYVTRYYEKLFPLIRPLLYKNGGPVIMLQIENEYGSYKACDFKYTAYLRDATRAYMGDDVILHTTDGARDDFMKCGKNDGCYTTVDFGPGADVERAFACQRRHQMRGPLMNSEFYTGWLDLWGQTHSTGATTQIVDRMHQMLNMNASFTLYMFHGGTNSGFDAGAEMLLPPYRPIVTSYDFDSPLNEAGDPTPKYYAIRDVISEYEPLPPIPVPKPGGKMSLSNILVSYVASLRDVINFMSWKSKKSSKPLSFEDMGHAGALMAYETTITARPSDPALLQIPGLRDRGYIYVDDEHRAILSRGDGSYSTLVALRTKQRLTILVENQGRISFGDHIFDRKGIIQDVRIGSTTVTNWTVTPGPFHRTEEFLAWVRTGPVKTAPGKEGFGVYVSNFTLPKSLTLLDTFLRLDGWGKGIAVLNGIILGRYWPEQGPQVTLYVPAVHFLPYPRENVLVLVELQRSPCPQHPSFLCSVRFVKRPELNGTVPDTRGAEAAARFAKNKAFLL